jgi:hypothetical protein
VTHVIRGKATLICDLLKVAPGATTASVVAVVAAAGGANAYQKDKAYHGRDGEQD